MKVIDNDIVKPEEKIEKKNESIFKQSDFPLAFPHPCRIPVAKQSLGSDQH